jgi:glycyl-tRNA synthetase beta chain
LPDGPPVRIETPQEERDLFDALAAEAPRIDAALAAEDVSAALTALAGLRTSVDAFFEKVLINADDPAVRANRLRLLVAVREEARKVADFSRVSG